VNSFTRFPYIILSLQQKQVHHWKEHEILAYKQNEYFAFSFYFYAASALEEHGNACEPVRIVYACRTYKQSVTYALKISGKELPFQLYRYILESTDDMYFGSSEFL
jgi:hypothetical protein